MKTNSFLTLCLFAITLISCNSGEKFNLAYRFSPNETYEIYTESETTMNQEMMGEKVNMQNTQEMWVDWVVKEMDKDSVYTVDVIYRRIKSTIESGDSLKVVDTDSSNFDLEALDMQEALMINQKLEMKVAKNGSVKELNGVESIIKSLIGKDLSTSPALKLMTEKLSNESMKSSMAQYQIFSEKPVRIGETWKNSYSMDMVVVFDADNEFTLESVNGDKARIKQNGKIKTGKSSSGGMAGMLGSMMQVEGTVIGFYEINLKTGEIASSENETVIKASISMMGMKMPMNISTKSKTRMLKKQ